MAPATNAFVITLGMSSMMLSLANEFLKATPEPTVSGERVSEQDIQTSLLDEVEGTLGAGSAGNRLSQMESILRPIVAALPKNQHGNLGHSAVRYALHRIFVLRHGWVIKGLQSEGDAKNASSPSGVLTDHVPAYLEGLFEQRLQGKGLNLHETSVLAATIEHLIHDEAVGRLGAAFNVHELPVTRPVSQKEATEVLDTYMMGFILGENIENMTVEAAQGLTKDMPEIYLSWQETMSFVRSVQKNVTKAGDSPDFAGLAKAVQIVGERFGSFQDSECKQLKDKLMKMEYRGTGRVMLSDFYKPALAGADGAWQFQESVSYLRQLGALDESDAKQPSVMIANWLNSQTNCLAASGFYSVCCKNECENLLSHLEQNIGASEAKPATIAALVSDLASSTVATPNTVPSGLLQRLDEIAAAHEGMVPLHGRLFAQWMHHVYPRECSFPHISGTTSAVTGNEWTDVSGADSTASEEEMLQYTKQATNTTGKNDDQGDLAVEELMPWSTEEELFVVKPVQLGLTGPESQPASVRTMMLLSAAGSLAFALIRSLGLTSRADGGMPQKYVI